MGEYIHCPNCEIKIPLKRKGDAFTRASSLPPEMTWKKLRLDVENWKPYLKNHGFDDEKSEVVGALSKSPEPEKWSSNSDSSSEDEITSISTESLFNAEEHNMGHLYANSAVDNDSIDGHIRRPDSNLVNSVQKKIVDLERTIAKAEEAENIEREAHTRDSVEKFPSSKEPELLRKFLKREFPSIAGGSLGNLVEKYQAANPRIKIVNLYDLPYNVHGIRNYKLYKNGSPKFLVQWDGWSEKSVTWEAEETIKNNATPALSLHISDFFFKRGRLEFAWEYLRRFVNTVFTSPQALDYLVLSKLAGEKLPVQNDCVVPKSADYYREKLETLLRERALLSGSPTELERFLRFVNERLEALECYQKWTEKISKKEPGADFEIENLVDCEDFLAGFVYITDHIVSDEVEVRSPKKFCKCQHYICMDNNCCGRHASRFGWSVEAYKNGRLRNQCSAVPLHECNSKCTCGFACSNRLIQHGCQLKLTIFKTVSRGWGIRARTAIRKGTFVGEYLGELMTSAAAVSRHSVNFTYLFDLMPIKGEPSRYTIDAAKFGNFTRFLNHSCQPNLRVSYAYTENGNVYAPRIAFFAKKDISCGEELTFDYHLQMTDGTGDLSRMKCLCAAPNCKKLLF